jgi:hypothetical protein
LKRNECCLLSCKRTNNCGIAIINFFLYGHFLCSMILLQKSITISFKAWGAYCATPWLQFLIIVAQHDWKKVFFFYNPTHGVTSMKKMLIMNMGLLWSFLKSLLMKMLMGVSKKRKRGK